MTRRTTTLFIILSLMLAGAPSASGQQGVDSKRREAAELTARIARQGEQLSLATEAYNEAGEERRRLEVDLEDARADVSRAEARWSELSEILGRRVRVLYKHPGAWADVLLSARSLGELGRARVLAGSVTLNDTKLLGETEKARREMLAKAETLAAKRGDALAKERELASAQRTVEREMQAERTLLADVEGEISELMEAERRREIEEASARRAADASRARAVTETPRSTPSTGQTPQDEPREKPKDEPKAKAPAPPARAPRASAAKAVQTAREQIGKPYKWGAEGPDSYDCSGLTKYAWASAGVNLPHSSRAQYSSLPKVSQDELQPGDLVFYGDPIHHVGIYEGNGTYINAPETGQNVRRNSIYRRDWAGAARP